MDEMEVVTSEEGDLEDTNTEKEIEEPPGEPHQTGFHIADTSLTLDELSTAEEVQEDMQVKLQIETIKSLHDLEAETTNSPTNRGDEAIDQQTFVSKDAIPSTSKVVVRRRAREPRPRDMCILRPILPRKSKEKAKQMMKVIARGIFIPRGVVFRQRIPRRKRRRVPKPTLKMLRLVKNKRSSRTSLQTLWARDRSQRYRSRSADSVHSDYECCRCDF